MRCPTDRSLGVFWRMADILAFYNSNRTMKTTTSIFENTTKSGNGKPIKTALLSEAAKSSTGRLLKYCKKKDLYAV